MEKFTGGGGQRNTQGKQKPPKGRTAKRCIGGKEKPTGVGGVRSREMHTFLYGKVRFFFFKSWKIPLRWADEVGTRLILC